MAKDLYEVLGVSKSASPDEIKSAYRKLTKEFHPDKFANKPEAEKKAAEEKFKEINRAYEVLSDPNKKANYDQYGSEDGPQGFGGFGEGSGEGFGGFEDILSSFFGGGMGGRRQSANSPEQGDDIQIRINLTFEEAYTGVSKTVSYSRDDICDTCHGTGAKDGILDTCQYCKGTGTIRRTQNTLFGQQIVQTVCPHCGGKGKTAKEKCRECRGNGTIRKTVSKTINIPGGVETGIRMTIRNEGNAGKNGGPRGNLVVAIVVADSPKFKRDGNDLYMDYPISYYEAACGCEIELDTMKGKAKTKVPEGTQSGVKLRMKGYGMKVLQKEAYGDLYITIKVETPKGLSSKQAKLLKDFEDSLSENQYPLRKNSRKK